MKTATAQGWIGRDTGNVTAHSTIDKYGTVIGQMRKLLNKSHGSRRVKATILALTGTAVGGASKAYSVYQVSSGDTRGQAGQNNLGGKRTIVALAKDTGVTTAADLADIDNGIGAKSRLASYPANKNGWAPGNINKL